jgi:phospholipase C
MPIVRLRLALLVVLASLLAGCISASRPQNAAVAGTATGTTQTVPPGLEKIDHLIFIVQENRSFDHYFGTFPGADGLPLVEGKPLACVPDPVLKRQSCAYHTSNLDQIGGPHNHTSSTTSVNGGKMDGFIRALPQTQRWCVDRTAKECRPFVGPDLQPDVMSWHDDREIPNYWRYAEEFVLQDAMFAPADSWTLPSHLFLVSAWSAYCTDPDDPMTCSSNLDLKDHRFRHDYGEPPTYAWTDITWLLHQHGVSWGYYVGSKSCSFGTPCGEPRTRNGPTPAGKNPLPGFTTILETGQQGNVQRHEDFYEQVADGTLPPVSWVVPGQNVSEHPQSKKDIDRGMAHVTRLINAVGRSELWDSSAIFVTWDDWGGFYDHAVPPRVDENGWGLRVPGFLVSPYAKQGFIDHQPLSFDAYLKLIEDRFLGGLRLDPEGGIIERPDPRPTVREEVELLGDLTLEFDFAQEPRSPLLLDPNPFN